MQLSSRILTALAVLILAVAVVGVRAASTGTVEAATGTIDVLNVGTCYTTDTDTFAVGACDDGDGAYNVTGRDTISETGTVYATYSHDPKTAADNPRAILENSDLIKVSIQDTGRDVRTPVVLPVGPTSLTIPADDYGVISGAIKNIGVVKQAYRAADTTVTPNITERTVGTRSDEEGITAAQVLEFTAQDGTKTYHLADDMYWGDDGDYQATVASRTDGALNDTTLTTGVEDGLTVLLDADGADDTAGNADDVIYLPMHADDNAVIKFFGCVSKPEPSPGTTAVDADCEDTWDGDFQDLTGNAFVLDEDRGSGRTALASDGDGTAVAPWLNVQVHNARAVLQYVVYYTSERESLIGGGKDVGYETGVHKPVFTKSEKDSKSALTVRAKSDGDVSAQNLWLYETNRFSGRYEGYVRLTDADGDGRGATGTAAANWGLQTKNASGHDDTGTAVLGVESGPIVIEYKDTDGASQSLTIMLDTVPPGIQIDTPAHKSEDQDTSPEFAGSFNDGESGLREDSFQLYVDNSNDSNENGDSNNSELALDLRVSSGSVTGNPYGLVNAPANDNSLVRSIEDYMGYSGTSMQFGVIDQSEVYGLEGDARLKVDGDRFDDGAATGTFADSVRIRITSGTPAKEVDPYNNTIDFHALVADVAGNIGFSDSDDSGPRFIHDYGTKSADRKAGRYNVLGWYARHIFFLDEKDPEIYQEQSVTGFYGINDDKKPVVNRSGILIAFDSAVDTDTISTETFEVTLDPADAQDTSPPKATVTDVTVAGRQVYLLLGEELASDATPSVRIASGESVSDPAGNRLTRGGMSAFDVKDGIAPKFTVTLSGGSGTGTDGEAANMLTNKAMTITITADEEINSTPSITVVCSNIGWDADDDGENEKDLGSFTGDRSGPLDKSSAVFPTPETYMCGDSTTAVRPQQVQSFSRPDLEWEYQWQNFSGDKALSDGKLTVVAYGRDRKSFASLKNRATDGSANAADTYNWGVNTAEFNFDITKPVLTPTPGNGDVVTDARPFVLLNYADKSTVSVTKLSVDTTDQTAGVQTLGARRFLYWPESLGIGSHAIVVEAIDAAGNKSGTDEYSFKVAERATFDIKLIAGWNAVSLPANPIDPEVGSVFTEAIVDMIAAWDGENPEAPWSIATRMDGEWSTHSDFATLTKISARYGYWVHAQGFVTQSVALVGKGNREDPSVVPADLVEIPTNPGWNFVGVIDQDGDQTQDNYGETLKNGTTAINAGSYLGKNMRAYTWDAIRGRFDILEDADSVMIGDGIWVYYGGGIAP